MTPNGVAVSSESVGHSADERSEPARERRAADAPPRARSAWVTRAVPVLVCVASALYASRFLTRGWVPHDEGMLGQTAMRVLAGQLPHRDFIDPYTGGLTYLNAAALRFFGTNLVAMRIPLFLLFLATLPAIYSIARRFVGTWGAAAVVLLGVAWGLPNYSAALPSWYNLFLAILGAAAVLKNLDTGQWRWLVLAGVCGGLSILAKIVGLYYVAAVLLTLVYHEHVQAAQQRDASAPVRRGIAYPAAVVAALGIFIIALGGLIRTESGPRWFVAFFLPGATIAAFLGWAVSRTGGGFRQRSTTLLRLAMPFLAGVALPLLCYLIPFAAGGAIGDLIRGVFVLPTLRLTFATMPPPPVAWTLTAVIPLVLILGVTWWEPKARGWKDLVMLGALMTVVLALAGTDARLYRLVWSSARTLLPVATVAGVILLMRVELGKSMSAERREEVFLLAALTGLCSLVQFPFAAPIYFCYVAPLLAMLVAALLASIRPRAPRSLAGIVAIFYVGFAVLWLNRGFIHGMGYAYWPDAQTAVLALPRGGLRVTAPDSAEYTRAVRLVRRVARGPYLYAAPDAPELDFLAGLENPTRDLFDFFDRNESPARILSVLRADHVHAVAINHAPGFSGPLPDAIRAALVARYPRVATVGKFEVRWRP